MGRCTSLWAAPAPAPAGPAALGLLLPLLAYASWHAADTGRFGLTQADGWFLYGRVGEIADCGNADVPPPRGRCATATRATGARARRTTSGTPTAPPAARSAG